MTRNLLLLQLRAQLNKLSGKTRMTLVLWSGAALVGVIAVMLAKMADWFFAGFHTLTERWFWWPLLSLPLGAVLIRWLMVRIGQGSEGSGIPQALAALQQTEQADSAERLLSFRIVLAKFLGIVLGVGSGFVLGREGPTVQIGAALMYSMRKLVPLHTAAFRRHLILAGGAAGIAAAFNTPLAGIVFAFEELSRSIENTTSGRTIGAVILAGMISLALLGNYTYFGRIHVPTFSFTVLIPMVLIAGVAGVIGGLFSWMCVNQRRWLPGNVIRLRSQYPYRFVALCGLAVALCGLVAPIYGSGALETSQVISGHGDMGLMYLPMKFIGLTATFLTGLPGGIFAPSLSLGAGLGSWFVPLFPADLNIKIVALGMVAMLAAVTRAPITSAIIMIEMTDGHVMVISMLGAAMIASGVASMFRTHLYQDLAKQFLPK
ncbi:chloride channel protein [Chromobacterium phragmitis]|uniref:Chloride channel protein n=1 Tax=Chromobacterium phragmitis TaxID=2202141 RepID=A0A344UGG4_9NEIS|nr:chloride channel protein [Chromobacterium phragmitis]AXE29002.1 chloride channel protein [Chromobacterium phragmitis]AXE34362.1 chloride channel protein [Chromobacterium phragmitis]